LIVLGRWGRRLAVGAGILCLALGTLLWTLGQFTIPPPWALRVLVFFGGGLGLTLAIWAAVARRMPGGVRPFALTAGLVAFVAAGAFVVALVSNGDDSVPVTRRVSASPAAPNRLRLVQFNVLHGYPRFEDHERRYQGLAAALRALAPDLIVLQEAWDTSRHGRLAERLGAALDMDVAYARANGSRRLLGFEEGSAALSRYPIDRARRIVLRPRHPVWENRIALVARIALGPGVSLQIVGAHLDSDDASTRAGQADHLASTLQLDEYTVVAGDMNARDGPPVEAFLDRGLLDALPGGIDHVFVPARGGHWRVAEVRWSLRPEDLERWIGRAERISDHDAIVLDLRRREASPPRREPEGRAPYGAGLSLGRSLPALSSPRLDSTPPDTPVTR
jgi:endonuclease/exonuclease/phosphatase family metal-dependent hydrolase